MRLLKPFLVLAVILVLSSIVSAAECPDDCLCLTERDAIEKGYEKLCNNEKKVCGYEDDVEKYCWQKPVVTPTPSTTPYSCPDKCECMTEAKAREKFSCPTRCSDEVCGYETSTSVSALTPSTPMYCFKDDCPSAVCPEECACLSPDDVKEYEEAGVRLEKCTDQPCDEDVRKFCYRKVEWQCPTGCSCLDKEEGYRKGLEFCKDSTGNLVRCGVISAEHGVYKYCFKKPEERCQFDVYRRACTGYCPDNMRCVATSEYEVCEERCKIKLEECLRTDSEEECKKEFESCVKLCIPECACVSYECPDDCRCLSDEEVRKYREEGLSLERCKEEQCGDEKYCYKVVKECYYDYEKNVCVGECPDGKCNLNVVRRDTTGKVVYAECSCKPVGVCSDECVCLTKEEAYRKLRNPVTCSDQPCGREIPATLASVTMENYKFRYCFKEGTEKCYYDRERQSCVGSCKDAECRLFEDAYANPYCRCVSKVEPQSDAYVERILPETAEPLSCIPVKIKINPKAGTTGLIITETYPSEFEYMGATVEPDKVEGNTLKWLLMSEAGLKEQEIEYKLCLPRDALGDYYVKGLWETEDNAGEIMGDDMLKVLSQYSDWPPCPVTDTMLLSFVSQWAEGELTDLQMLQVIEIWANGC